MILNPGCTVEFPVMLQNTVNAWPPPLEILIQLIQLAFSICVIEKILMFSQDWNPGFSQGRNVTIK